MTIREFLIGTSGPFYYDDELQYVVGPDEDPSALDGLDYKAFVTDGQVHIGTRPSSDSEALRYQDMGGVFVLSPVSTVSIATPGIDAIVPAKDVQGAIQVVYQEADPSPDVFTIYLWDANYAGVDISPYVVLASGIVDGELIEGAWIAVAGYYAYNNQARTGIVRAAAYYDYPGGLQVVGTRKTAVAVISHCAGAAPTAAEYNALVDAFNDLVSKLSSASGHGLLAS